MAATRAAAFGGVRPWRGRGVQAPEPLSVQSFHPNPSTFFNTCSKPSIRYKHSVHNIMHVASILSKGPSLFNCCACGYSIRAKETKVKVSRGVRIGKPAGSGKVAHDLDSKLGSTCRVWKRCTRPKARLVFGSLLSLPVTRVVSRFEKGIGSETRSSAPFFRAAGYMG